MEKRQDVALVLSSGGARGLAHVGVIEELLAYGFTITSLSGSSIGALVGGLFAMGKLDEYSQWVKTIDRHTIWGLMDFSLNGRGLLKGERVFDNMKTFIPDVNIENFNIPFTAVATDIIRRKEVTFSSGSFYKAIRASIAIPTLFTPMEYEDSFLVDGGVLNPLPFEYVRKMPGTLLIAVNLNSNPVYSEPDNSNHKVLPSAARENKATDIMQLFDVFSRLNQTRNRRSLGYFSLLRSTTSAMVSQIASLSIEKHKPDILIEIPKDTAQTFDFYKAEEIIEYGRQKARIQLENFI